MGAVQQYLKYTLLNCCSLTQAWTGVFWKLDPVTSECLLRIDPHRTTPLLSPSPTWLFTALLLKPIPPYHCYDDATWPPLPASRRFLGEVREMHNQCNIHELKNKQTNYCTDFFFFLPLFVRVLFLPLYI